MGHIKRKNIYHLEIQFVMHDFDYVDENFIITCWGEDMDTDDINEAIEFGYEFMKAHNYRYFFINEKNNINKIYFDSKKEEENVTK